MDCLALCVERLAPPAHKYAHDGSLLEPAQDLPKLELLHAVATRVVAAARAVLSRVGSQPVKSLFALLQRLLLLAPTALYEPQELYAATWDLAVECLRLGEEDPRRKGSDI